MAKKIIITQKQLDEAMDVFVNKTNTENIQQALARTQKETEQEVGSNKNVNYVVSSDQVKENKIFTKAELNEARAKFLRNNSNTFNKKDFLKK